MSPRIIDPEQRFRNHDRRLQQLELGVPFPMLRAINEVTPVTIGSDNQEMLVWDYWEIGDDRVYEAYTFSGQNVETWLLKLWGAYLFDVSIVWGNTWIPASTTIILNDPYRNSVVTHHHTLNAFDDWYSLHVLREFPPFDPSFNFVDPDNPPSGFEFGVSANQNSGINQDVITATLSVLYLGGVSVPMPTPAVITGSPPFPPQRIDPQT